MPAPAGTFGVLDLTKAGTRHSHVKRHDQKGQRSLFREAGNYWDWLVPVAVRGPGRLQAGKETLMNSRDRVLAAFNHEETARVPIDFSGHRSSGIAAIAYAKLRKYLALEPRPIRVYDIQ